MAEGFYSNVEATYSAVPKSSCTDVETLDTEMIVKCDDNLQMDIPMTTNECYAAVSSSNSTDEQMRRTLETKGSEAVQPFCSDQKPLAHERISECDNNFEKVNRLSTSVFYSVPITKKEGNVEISKSHESKNGMKSKFKNKQFIFVLLSDAVSFVIGLGVGVAIVYCFILPTIDKGTQEQGSVFGNDANVSTENTRITDVKQCLLYNHSNQDQSSSGYFSCTCLPGWTGEACKIDIDECASEPCFNGATCNDEPNLFECDCAPGWSGDTCNEDVNECVSSPCRKGGTCNNVRNAFSCTCVEGWTGVLCETDVNECASSPCMNGGTCNDGRNAFSCICVRGWTGVLCETDVNECASSPCMNGGTCKDGRNAFSCKCVRGWTGVLCETDVNECASIPCRNGASCNNTLNAFSCTCMQGWTGILCQDAVRDCSVLRNSGGITNSGVFPVYPYANHSTFEVYCDMKTDSGGWTVFQRRQNNYNFYKSWNDYKDGFGDVSTNFWLGNDHIHSITQRGTYQLRVDLEDWEGTHRYAVYDSFSIGPESDNYRLHIGSYTGNAGDSLTGNNNQQFSTKDRDNDASASSCAYYMYGAWWFHDCSSTSHLNGWYYHQPNCNGIRWDSFRGRCYSLKRTEMKFRAVQ